MNVWTFISHAQLGLSYIINACGYDFSCRKYPTIRTDEEKDQYRAVFKDQYAEYKELHSEVQVLAKKFEEMDSLINNLQSQPASQMVMTSTLILRHILLSGLAHGVLVIIKVI